MNSITTSRTVSANHTEKDIVRDEQGAVMIMGLAMILGLIAFLWYLIGMGSTIAFRDHMQESVDSAAFSQPAVEALCMNIIVFINIIMMVMIAIYMAWSVIVTIHWMGSVLCCPIPPWECCLDIPAYIEDWEDRNTAAKYMAELDGILSPLESIIAIAAPWAGTGVAYLSSSSYQQKQMQSKPIGFAVSEMNIPGTLDLASTTGRFGLPVTHDYLGNDCSHLFDILFQSIGSLLGPVSKALNKVGGIVAGVVQYYWCDNSVIPGSLTQAGKDFGQTGGPQSQTTTDANGNSTTTTVDVPTFPPDGKAQYGTASSNTGCNTSNGWSTKGGILRVFIGGGDGGNYWNCGNYGPMMNYKHPIAHPPATGHDKEYKNDADMMQSFAATFIPNAYNDKDASRIIQFMQLQHMVGFSGSNTPPSSYGYYAQGELYFDCDGKWTDETCDDIQTGANGGTDMTMYRFQWRARLVKIHFPGGLGKFVNFLNGILGYVSDVRSYINSNGNSMSGIIGLVNKFDPSLVSSLVNMIGAIADPIPGTLAH